MKCVFKLGLTDEAYLEIEWWRFYFCCILFSIDSMATVKAGGECVSIL